MYKNVDKLQGQSESSSFRLFFTGFISWSELPQLKP